MGATARGEALCEGLTGPFGGVWGIACAGCWHLPQALLFGPWASGYAIAPILAQIGALMPSKGSDAVCTVWHHACIMAHEQRITERSDSVVVNGRKSLLSDYGRRAVS